MIRRPARTPELCAVVMLSDNIVEAVRETLGSMEGWEPLEWRVNQEAISAGLAKGTIVKFVRTVEMIGDGSSGTPKSEFTIGGLPAKVNPSVKPDGLYLWGYRR